MKILHNTKVKFTHSHRDGYSGNPFDLLYGYVTHFDKIHTNLSDTFLGSGSNTSVLFSDYSQD